MGVGLALATPSISYAQDIWHGATVGMTFQEIQKKFPTAHNYNHYVYAKKPYYINSFGWDSQNVDGCFFDINFNITDNKLKSVDTTLADQSTYSQYCQRISLEHLKNKYGSPSDLDISNPRASSARWDTKDGVRIVMLFSSFPAINRYLAFISYLKKPDSANNNIF